MLSKVYRCSPMCKCYSDIHVWAKHIRIQGGSLKPLQNLISKMETCDGPKDVPHSFIKVLPWSEERANVDYFKQL